MVKQNQILTLIQERHSSRVPFDPKHAVTKEDLKMILEAGRWAPTAHNMQNYEVIVVDNKELLNAIGKINYPISDVFVRENYQQLSFSEEEFLKKKVGLLGTMFPQALRNPQEQLRKNNEEKETSTIGRTIETSPVLLVILYNPIKRAPASEGDFLGIISLGCMMENMWLMAQSLGVAFHIVSALSNNTVETEVKKILNIPEDLKIAFSARLGYPATPPGKYLRVRRDIDDFTHYNKYGSKISN